MCGLAGFITRPSDSLLMHEHLMRMTRQIEHRGPDSDGSWIHSSSGIALGHRRLAIIDLTPAGAQPMKSPSGRWVLVFNGEIYNHLKLRDELEKSSSASFWRGHTDTETLLACFDAWGIRVTLQKCIGMFAMAVWCRQTHTLALVRDRFGEKPLYYGWQGSGNQRTFLFGSELKALTAHPVFAADINRQALASYMQNMVIAGTLTIYNGIHKVSPGALLSVRWQDPDPVSERFWSVEQVALQRYCSFSGSVSQAVDHLEVLLKDAVAHQITADVPLGAFLSGGVDSSTIVALMQAQCMQPVRTFSIGFNEPDYNEAYSAKAIAAHLGTDHTELYVSPEQALETIPLLPRLYDEPFADSSQIPTYLVSQLAAQHVKVALSGDAGDELFAGYNRYQITSALWPLLQKIPRPTRMLAGSVLKQFPPQVLQRLLSVTPLAKRWSNLDEKLHKGGDVLGSASLTELYQGILALGWAQPSILIRDCELSGHPFYIPDFAGLDAVESLSLLDLINYLPDDILTKVDRAAMGVSLETRVPFLDHRLVEFALSLPSEYKLRRENGYLVTKWLLRQVLYRYIPPALIERPKTGFGVPLEHWLRGPLRDWAEELLCESRIKRDGFLNHQPVHRRWREHLSGKRNWQHSIWCVLMFNAWLDEQRSATSI